MKKEYEDLVFICRMAGWGYKKIAKELNLKRDEVRLYCMSHGLGGQGQFVEPNYLAWKENHGRCLVCGKKLERKPKGRKRRFCSGRCRTIYCRAKKGEEQIETWTEDLPGWDGADEW